MPESAAEVVNAFFTRYERGGVEPALERLSPDAQLIVPPSMSAEPDTYVGHEGARRYFAGFEGALDDVRFELVQLHDAAPDNVVAEMRMVGRGSATGIEVAQRVFTACTVAGGLIVRIEAHPDLESALASG